MALPYACDRNILNPKCIENTNYKGPEPEQINKISLIAECENKCNSEFKKTYRILYEYLYSNFDNIRVQEINQNVVILCNSLLDQLDKLADKDIDRNMTYDTVFIISICSIFCNIDTWKGKFKYNEFTKEKKLHESKFFMEDCYTGLCCAKLVIGAITTKYCLP